MSRRKGVPCGCDADPCGCSPKNHCVKKINGISSDPNGDFTISAGAGIEIHSLENEIQIDGSGSVGVLTINGQDPDADGDFSGLVEGSGNIGSDIKPVKIVNGEAVAVSNDLVSTAGNQVITSPLGFENSGQSDIYIKRNIDISSISGSTPLTSILFKTQNTSLDLTDFMFGRIQGRRYANRTRIWISLFRVTDAADETALAFEQYDNGRVALNIYNTISGVTTTHTLLDSNP